MRSFVKPRTPTTIAGAGAAALDKMTTEASATLVG
jgi:hypothetical protein